MRDTDAGKRSIRNALLVPMVAVNLVIAFIFVGTIVATRFFDTVRQSEVNSLQRIVRYRGERIQDTMNQLSSLALALAEGVQSDASQAFPGSDILWLLRSSPGNVSRLLSISVPRLSGTLLHNTATGAFVLLDCSALDPDASGPGGGDFLAAAYLNDEDLSSVSDNNGDFNLLYGPKGLARSLNVPLNNSWNIEMPFSDYENIDFFSLPLEAARAHPNLPQERLGHWSRPIRRADGREVIFYTLPLLDGAGRAYGVAGVEISVARLQLLLEVGELGNSKDAFYLLGEFSDPNVPAWSISNGMYAATHPYDEATVKWTPQADGREWLIDLQYRDWGERATAVPFLFPVYYSGSPFGSSTWGVVGVVSNAALFENITRLLWFLVGATAIALLAGAALSLFAANRATAPIVRLSDQLREIDPDKEVRLEKTRITEIDMLIQSIEQLNVEVLAIGARTQETIRMTDMPIGFFEINPGKERVYLTDLLFGWFGLPRQGDSNLIPINQWLFLRADLMREPHPSEEGAFHYRTADGAVRWLRIKTAQDTDKVFGVIVDISDELRERRRLEQERDTDPLTGLFTRDAFFKHAEELICHAPDLDGLLVFADLDNLKFINDNYGHDYGDRYIRAAAEVFSQLGRYGGVVSRISGDEFAIFLYGFADREKLVSLVASHFRSIPQTQLQMPDNSSISLRCSAGFAWYPADSDNLETLLRYADFAMYETKRTAKGQWREFSLEAYLKNSFVLERNQELTQLIEEELVRYAFQPIVDIHSGLPMGYEAFLRPRVKGLESPTQVMDVARAQAKLYQIERLTLFQVLQWMEAHPELIQGRKIFFSSIAGQVLSPRDYEELEERYPHLLPLAVAQISEGSRVDPALLADKLRLVRSLGVGLAISHYGSGLAGEKLLSQFLPQYVKLDHSLAARIETEKAVQKQVGAIAKSVHAQGGKVIACGVETRSQAAWMIRLGADCLQGYYLAKPGITPPQLSDEVIGSLRELSAKYRDRRGPRSQS